VGIILWICGHCKENEKCVGFIKIIWKRFVVQVKKFNEQKFIIDQGFANCFKHLYFVLLAAVPEDRGGGQDV